MKTSEAVQGLLAAASMQGCPQPRSVDRGTPIFTGRVQQVGLVRRSDTLCGHFPLGCVTHIPSASDSPWSQLPGVHRNRDNAMRPPLNSKQ
jgi:hypothetical protein